LISFLTLSAGLSLFSENETSLYCWSVWWDAYIMLLWSHRSPGYMMCCNPSLCSVNDLFCSSSFFFSTLFELALDLKLKLVWFVESMKSFLSLVSAANDSSFPLLIFTCEFYPIMVLSTSCSSTSIGCSMSSFCLSWFTPRQKTFQ